MADPLNDSDLKEMAEIIGDLAHTSAILTRTARIETDLRLILESRLPKLSKNLSARLFEGYGNAPFGSLSAKIDVLYAMGVIDAPLQRDLHVLRELRNAFAHTTSHRTFRSQKVGEIFAKFPDFGKNETRQEFYLRKVQEIDSKLIEIGRTSAIIKALTGGGRAT